jgi:hypothetical protein
VPVIKVEDYGRKATFENPLRKKHFVYEVDGCMVDNETASDFVVAKVGFGDLIVELKGRDVDHAVKQIFATVQLWGHFGLRNGRLAALIVCSQYPRSSKSVRRAQQKFASAFKEKLVVKCGSYAGSFDDLFRK